MENGDVRKVSICIERPADEAYDFLSVPQNFPRWASGLGRALRKVDGEWIAETPEGPARVSFSERNAFGVLDHSVVLPQGGSVYVPLRVLPRERGCELELTLIRRAGVSEEQFAADAAWVLRDLEAAKRLLERGGNDGG
jgi:hypothetical protein